MSYSHNVSGGGRGDGVLIRADGLGNFLKKKISSRGTLLKDPRVIKYLNN